MYAAESNSRAQTSDRHPNRAFGPRRRGRGSATCADARSLHREQPDVLERRALDALRAHELAGAAARGGDYGAFGLSWRVFQESLGASRTARSDPLTTLRRRRAAGGFAGNTSRGFPEPRPPVRRGGEAGGRASSTAEDRK